MYICYIDESGTPELKDGIHYVLIGIAIPIYKWRECDLQINSIKSKYGLYGSEIHTAWMNRYYAEQKSIKDFEQLTRYERRNSVEKEFKKSIALATVKGRKNLTSKYKEIKNIKPYIHLTHKERFDCLRELCDLIGSWKHARLFGECIDKSSFKKPPKYPPYEEAFSQLVSRFERFLLNENQIGMLVYDNNKTLAKRLTELMIKYHEKGTMFTEIKQIFETPFFVDSALTQMIQISDLCAFATRRFCDKDENDLFDRIYGRIQYEDGNNVGLRHYVKNTFCKCKICSNFLAC